MPEPGGGYSLDRKLPNAPPAGKSTRRAYSGKLMPAYPACGRQAQAGGGGGITLPQSSQ